MSACALERLSACYFQNADAFDSVRVFVTASLDPAPDEAPALDASGTRSVGRFRFDVDLYRVTEGLALLKTELGRIGVPKGTLLLYEIEGVEYEDAVLEA